MVDPATKKSLEVFQKMKVCALWSGRARLTVTADPMLRQWPRSARHWRDAWYGPCCALCVAASDRPWLAGIVNILDREFNLDGFAAYTGTIHFLVQVVSRNVLVTVGQDKDVSMPSVKIWNMDKEDKGGSRLLKVIKLQVSCCCRSSISSCCNSSRDSSSFGQPFSLAHSQQLPDKATVTSFAVLDDGKLIAR